MQMIGLKSNKVRDVYLWFKKGIKAVSDERECTAVADEVFLRVLNMPRDQRVLKADERLSETNLVRLIKAQKRLNNHEPVQYVTGVAAFRGLLFRVRPGVLIPRQETEGLVDLVIRMTDEDRERPQYTHSFLDIGTGSGCIAISLKAALPDHPVSACDYDDMILELAGSNAADNNTSVDFFRCNIFMRDGSGLKNRLWDYIVSNPPYVRESEKSGMSPQVLDHEPGMRFLFPTMTPWCFTVNWPVQELIFYAPEEGCFWKLTKHYLRSVSSSLYQKVLLMYSSTKTFTARTGICRPGSEATLRKSGISHVSSGMTPGLPAMFPGSLPHCSPL